MSREAWLAERRTGLGGTDMAAILGASTWSNALTIYLKKVEGLETPASFAMNLGNAWEALVAHGYAVRTGYSLTKPELVRHPGHEFLLGSPDFLVQDRADLGLEIKTSNIQTLLKDDSKWGADGSGDVPMDYWVQCQWYMGLTGRAFWDLHAGFYDLEVAKRMIGRGLPYEVAYAAALVEERTYHLQADPEFFELAVAAGIRFWEAHVLPQVRPEGQTMLGEARDFLLQRMEREEKRVIEAAGEVAQALVDLAAVQADIKASKGREEACKAILDNALVAGDAQELHGAAYRWTLQGFGKKRDEDVEAVIRDLALRAAIPPAELLALRQSHTTETPKTPYGRIYPIKAAKSKTTSRKEAA